MGFINLLLQGQRRRVVHGTVKKEVVADKTTWNLNLQNMHSRFRENFEPYSNRVPLLLIDGTCNALAIDENPSVLAKVTTAKPQ